MKRNPERTPDSQIRSGLRNIWLRSRERGSAIRNANNSCECCGVKGRAKDTKNGPKQRLEVHHMDGKAITTELVSLIRRRLLPNPDRLKVVCPNCHAKEHEA